MPKTTKGLIEDEWLCPGCGQVVDYLDKEKYYQLGIYVGNILTCPLCHEEVDPVEDLIIKEEEE